MNKVTTNLLLLLILNLATPLFSTKILANDETSLLVFAASSLTESYTALASRFTERSNIEVILHFAGSATLAVQIQNGAPADIFASADEAQLQRVVDSGLVDPDTVMVFAENELVIAIPEDNPAMIESAADLARPGLLLVMAAEVVPARVYTDQLLLTLAETYGETYPNAVYANLVSEETNVRQVVTRLVLGEADAGIVYRTDVNAGNADDVKIVPIPHGTSPLATYPIAPLIESNNSVAAAQFVEFVLSNEGQLILQEYGFCPITDTVLFAEVTPEATPESESTPEPDSGGCS